MIADRLSEDARTRRTASDPQERLQRYVVLEYPTHQAALAAFRRLDGDEGALSVEWNDRFEFAATPSDSLFFAPNSSPTPKKYQWGMSASGLNFQGAWDKTWGTAYVAILDSGVQLNPLIHPDLSKAFRPHFAYNVHGGNRYVDEAMDKASTIMGHGTHVAGIVSANSNDPLRPIGLLNPPGMGVAGGCWSCSLMVIKITRPSSSDPSRPSVVTSTLASGLVRAVNQGAQVVNLSLVSSSEPVLTCASSGWAAFCAALQLAADRDVVVVAAAGNTRSGLRLPAMDPRVLPVAGVDTSQNRWGERIPGGPELFGSSSGVELQMRGVAAPAKDILSTIYQSFDWNRAVRCGDRNEFTYDPGTSGYQYPDEPGDGDTAGPGYGRCTGTSMAAPHITAAAALVRTANPLLNRIALENALRNAGSKSGAPDIDVGFGIPNVAVSVATAMGSQTAKNRLTPLFAFERTGELRYTVAVQVAAAMASPEFDAVFPTALDKAMKGGIPTGVTVNEMLSLPGVGVTPKAQIWVLTGHVNPRVTGQALLPILRFSRSAIGLTPGDFAYETSESRAQMLLNAGYRFDGVEGFVFSAQFSQPSGTVRIYRARNPANGDNAIFPESQLNAMTSAGYSVDVNTLGYAYANATGARPAM